MYKAIIVNGRKEPTFISLKADKADEPVKPVYDGNYSQNKKAIEASYGPFGHNLGSKYSVEELEFAIKQLGFKIKVLEDVKRNEFYQVEKSESYT
jgi:hypothetical protein